MARLTDDEHNAAIVAAAEALNLTLAVARADGLVTRLTLAGLSTERDCFIRTIEVARRETVRTPEDGGAIFIMGGR